MITLRVPKAISPSAFFLYQRDLKGYYLKYLSPRADERFTANRPMSIGSAFDAYVKCALDADLGINKLNLEEMYCKQVHESFQDECRTPAIYILSEYKKCGAYSILLKDLEQSEIEPMFEFLVGGSIGGVPIKGFPDGFYINKDHIHCIIDWKVNGYDAGTGKSKPYYTMDHRKKQSHKKTIVVDGVNASQPFEKVDKEWAFQQMVYALSLGAEDYICTLEQTAGAPEGLNFFTYKARVSKEWQNECIEKLQELWHKVTTGLIFSDDPEENEKLIEEFEGVGRMLM